MRAQNNRSAFCFALRSCCEIAEKLVQHLFIIKLLLIVAQANNMVDSELKQHVSYEIRLACGSMNSQILTQRCFCVVNALCTRA